MSDIINLEPRAVWHFFDLVCSIPHPSGHEQRLAEKLMEEAEKHGLSARRDAAGNVRIDRPAAPGMENLPTIILQGHMDMVPESDHEFDFINTPISPRIDGEWVTACGTTLGADNGIGVAQAMAILCDPALKCGALAGVFTFEEETGMGGAAQIDPAFLAGDYLLNCDNDSSGQFCIGCAGGARQKFTFVPEWCLPEKNACGLSITLTGLPGGHSGSCIQDDRGNAIRFLAEFLDMHPEIALCSFDAGQVDNAIPAEAVVRGASVMPPEELQKLADAFTLLIKEECTRAGNMRIIITPAALPKKVWSAKFTGQLIPALALAPDGVMAYSEEFNAVRDSSNLAIIKSSDDAVMVFTSQRSLVDAERDNVCDLVKNHFTMFGAAAEKGHIYPATTPKPASSLLALALDVRKKMGLPASVRVIHAGLESGWFSIKNPDLEILSCGPHMEEYHTPRERLSITSVQEFDRFLRLLLNSLTQQRP